MTARTGWKFPAALDEGVAVLRAAGVDVGNPRELVRDIVAAYEVTKLDLERKRMCHHIHEHTKTLARLEVGRGVLLQNTSQDAVRMKQKAARKLMDPPNPHAVWHSETRPDGLWVERIADGTKWAPPPTRSPVVRELLTVPPGRTMVSKTIPRARGLGQLNTWHKARAREALNDPAAEWSVKTHGDKVRLTRVR